MFLQQDLPEVDAVSSTVTLPKAVDIGSFHCVLSEP
jgi:hypothetical protein